MVTKNTSGRIALLDMDGTLADYDAGLARDYDKIIDDEELNYAELMQRFGDRDKLPQYIFERRQLITSQVGWWRNLPKLDVGFEIVSVLDEFHFDFHVATKGPSSKPQAWKEKVEWVREHLPEASVHVTEQKSLLYGKVLVDDWPPYVESWLQWRPRGLVVMPAHNYNKDMKMHPQVLRYKSGMQDTLKEILGVLLNED